MEKKPFAITLDQANKLMYEEVKKVYSTSNQFVSGYYQFNYENKEFKEDIDKYCSQLAESLITLNELRALFLKAK